MRTELVETALKNAAATTVIEPLAVFHSASADSIGRRNTLITEVLDGTTEEADAAGAGRGATAVGRG
jgi:hypothetical protein